MIKYSTANIEEAKNNRLFVFVDFSDKKWLHTMLHTTTVRSYQETWFMDVLVILVRNTTENMNMNKNDTK